MTTILIVVLKMTVMNLQCLNYCANIYCDSEIIKSKQTNKQKKPVELLSKGIFHIIITCHIIKQFFQSSFRSIRCTSSLVWTESTGCCFITRSQRRKSQVPIVLHLVFDWYILNRMLMITKWMKDIIISCKYSGKKNFLSLFYLRCDFCLLFLKEGLWWNGNWMKQMTLGMMVDHDTFFAVSHVLLDVPDGHLMDFFSCLFHKLARRQLNTTTDHHHYQWSIHSTNIN